MAGTARTGWPVNSSGCGFREFDSGRKESSGIYSGSSIGSKTEAESRSWTDPDGSWIGSAGRKRSSTASTGSIGLTFWVPTGVGLHEIEKVSTGSIGSTLSDPTGVGIRRTGGKQRAEKLGQGNRPRN